MKSSPTPTLSDPGEPSPGTSVKRSLGARITGWTNNLLATSVVLIVALTVGTQLVSLWDTDASSNSDTTPSFQTSWPTMESCAIEFGNHPYTLSREPVHGSAQEVVSLLTQKCTDVLNSSPTPSQPVGQSERRMIEESRHLKPLAEERGRWRLFQSKDPQGRDLPMVIGIRDDCGSKSSPHSRLVTWGIGIASTESEWTTFVCQTREGSANQQAPTQTTWVPACSRRTLSIGDRHGSQLIGFQGGALEEIKRFYSRLSEKQGWSQPDWVQNGTVWHAYLNSAEPQATGGIRIRMAPDHENRIRGLVVVEPETLTR